MAKLTRRGFLKGAVAGGAALGLSHLLGCPAQPAGSGPRVAGGRRPNFVFILVDDQRFDAMGFTGAFPFLKTPNIDRLAAEGAVFQNAFVTTSLCSPSRASILTGTYPHVHGVKGNETQDFDPRLPNLGPLLQAAGYRTAFIGKWHQAATAAPRAGFDTWYSFARQGQYTDPPMNENGREVQTKGYVTDILNDYAVNWIAQQEPSQQKRQQPFCLFLWHKAMHGPFQPADRHAQAFADAQLKPNPAHSDDLAGKPRWQRWLATTGKAKEIMPKGAEVPDRVPAKPFNPQTPKVLNMLRTLLPVDEGVGRILETLARTGVLDDTVVIFGSDNGYFFGEHRQGDKRSAYEDSLRVPLLVRYPRLCAAGARIDAQALYLDLAPTILDLAGVAVPPTMQGRSLRPLLAGKTPGDWRKSWLYEYYRDPEIPAFPAMLAVRTPKSKYVVYPEDPKELEELYDLEHDRYELKNLAGDPSSAATRSAMREELLRLMREAGCPALDKWPA